MRLERRGTPGSGNDSCPGAPGRAGRHGAGLAGLAGCVLLVACAGARTVDPGRPAGSGDRSAGGTVHRVASGAEFDRAVAAARAGDQIVFASGTYRDVRLSFAASGTAAAPITLRAETAGQTIFQGRSQLILAGDWLVASGFRFEGIAGLPKVTTAHDVAVAAVVTFRATANHARLTDTAVLDPDAGVSGYLHMEPGGQHNRVDHCWFSGQRDIGPSLYIEVDRDRPNHATVESCFIGNRRRGNGNRWETLRIGHSEQQSFRSSALITRNYFYRCDGENEMISNKSTGNKYLHNTFIDNRGELTLRHGDEAWIEGNFFDDTGKVGAPGIRVIGKGHVIVNNYLRGLRFGLNVYAAEANPEPRGYARVEDAVIAFNTLDGVREPFLIGTSGRPAPPRNVRIAYNLVKAADGTSILSYANPAADVKYEGNIMFGGSLGVPDRPGIHRDPPGLKQDPLGRLVVDRARSPFAGEAAAYPQAARDLDGTDRGGSPNVGALQAAGTTPRYPRSPKEVGPAWMGREANAGREGIPHGALSARTTFVP
jgi:poly(beta-D-mannuronate) lyase